MNEFNYWQVAVFGLADYLREIELPFMRIPGSEYNVYIIRPLAAPAANDL